jgi:KaiC/GvpD/RAD55 family RecA-like ATPase
MSSDDGTRYAFGKQLPVEPIEAGSTVMVSGPAFSAAEPLVRSLVMHAVEDDEGSLFISTKMTSEKLLTACRRTNPNLDTRLTGIIDCSGQEPKPDATDAEVKYVSTQSDLTGIGMKFSALYESLYAEAVDGRVRTGLISLSSLAMYVDLRKLFRFAQTLAGRIDSAGGLGVFAIDPTTHDDRTVNTLAQVADGRIEVREYDGHDKGIDGELRVRGLPDQPGGWQPFSLS